MGTNNDDAMTGTAGFDDMRGRGGGDAMRAGGGADKHLGGRGNDPDVSAGSGDDSIEGQEGDAPGIDRLSFGQLTTSVNVDPASDTGVEVTSGVAPDPVNTVDWPSTGRSKIDIENVTGGTAEDSCAATTR